jgi:hypothetical protein
VAFAQQEEDMKYKVEADGLFSNGVGVFKISDINKAPFLDRRMLRLIENKADQFQKKIVIHVYDEHEQFKSKNSPTLGVSSYNA